VEEFYVITWDAKKEQIFEMPTGGAAIMRKGPNLIKFSKKEQCLALTTQLRTKFKTDACFYRVFPDGAVEYLHPADGVYPEKVNAGRVGVNTNMRRVGQNVNPIQVRRARPARPREAPCCTDARCGLPCCAAPGCRPPDRPSPSPIAHRPSPLAGQVHRQGPRRALSSRAAAAAAHADWLEAAAGEQRRGAREMRPDDVEQHIMLSMHIIEQQQCAVLRRHLRRRRQSGPGALLRHLRGSASAGRRPSPGRSRTGVGGEADDRRARALSRVE
jgi:hypothetical protein